VRREAIGKRGTRYNTKNLIKGKCAKPQRTPHNPKKRKREGLLVLFFIASSDNVQHSLHAKLRLLISQQL